MKNKKTLSIIAVCLVSAIAVTYAAFNTSFEVGNKFKMNDATAEFVEEFNAPKEGEIVAGKTYNKSGQVFNKGTVPVKARAKISISWKDDSGNTVVQKPNGMLDAVYAYTLHFGNTISSADANVFQTESEKDGDNFAVAASGTGDNLWKYDNSDNYFYYKGQDGTIAKNSESSKLLESIEFSTKLTDVDETKKYYLANDAGYTKPYNTQEEAAANAQQGEAIKYRSITQMKYPTYKDLTLVVTIKGEIIEADATWATTTP